MTNQSLKNAFQRFWEHTVSLVHDKADKNELSAHTSDVGNPHGVTAEQVGADPKGSAATALADAQTYAEQSSANTLELANEYADNLVGGIPEPAFIVTISGNDIDGYSANKAFNEIKEAYDNNLVVLAAFEDSVNTLSVMNESTVVFGGVNQSWFTIIITSENAVSVSERTPITLEENYDVLTDNKSITGAIDELHTKATTLTTNLNSYKTDFESHKGELNPHNTTYNDLLVKPFYDITNDTLVWDGNTAGLTCVDFSPIGAPFLLYKVSNQTLTISELENIDAKAFELDKVSSFPNISVAEPFENFCTINDMLIISFSGESEQEFLPDSGIYFKEPGIYFAYNSGSYVHSLTVPGRTFTNFKQIDEKFIPNTIASDWNENDENSRRYIKNRTHYTELQSLEELFNESALVFTNGQWQNDATGSNDLSLILNKEYNVTFDSQVFGCICKDGTLSLGMEALYLGNLHLYDINGENTGEPFFIVITANVSPASLEDDGRLDSTYIRILIIAEDKTVETHNIVVHRANEYIKQLDEKYIPDSIARFVTQEEAIALLAETGFISPATTASGDIYTNENGDIYLV